MEVNLFYSRIYNVLLKYYRLRDSDTFAGKIWKKAWDYFPNRYPAIVSTTIHGYKAKVNNGNSYPLFARVFNKYNNPLLQLVFSAHALHKRKLQIIDVGSATGDTNLFLLRNLPNTIEKFFCIEGDDVFFKLLLENKSHFPDCKLYNVLLSDSDTKKIGDLVKTHLGTASAFGEKIVDSCSLDTLLYSDLGEHLDVLKIDVDGFDGKVLKGSKRILSEFQPLVIFEWHPILISKTENDFFEAFEVLNEVGYDRFVWYTKYGDFSHFDFNVDLENRKNLVEVCLRNNYDYDWHYDIIAIHKDSEIDLLELAEMNATHFIESRF